MREHTFQNISLTTYTRTLSFLPVALVGIFLLILGIYIDRINTYANQQEFKNTLLSKLSVIRAKLEGNINSNATLVKGLVVAISLEPDMSTQRFTALTTPLLSGRSQIRNIAAAPDLVIRYMNPIAGNEAAIGINYRDIPQQFNAVNMAREKGELILDGPVDLIQGGQGFIARIPVFTTPESGNTSKFWGIVSSVIDVEKFYKASGLYDKDLNFDIAISNQSDTGNQAKAFFGDPKVFDSDPIVTQISLPYGSWLLAATPKEGWLINTQSSTPFRAGLLVTGLVIFIPLLILSVSIAKRRESENRLRLLFELSPVGIALNNFETGAFIEANDTLLKATGYTYDEFMNLSYSDITPVKYKKDKILNLENLEKTGRYGPYEKEYIRKDGSHYPVLLNGMMINDTSGKKMIWSFVEDISKRKQAEKNLQRSQKMDAIGQLTGGIAHDFNNILGIILGNLELLSDDLSDQSDKVNKRIDSINKAAQRAVDLTKQLLIFSRKKPAQQTCTNINNLVEDMENLISRSITPEIDVSHQLENNLWLCKIDQGEFEDALLNLSINARDAMKKHGKLIIKTRNVTLSPKFCELIDDSRPGEYIELSVSDNGTGISAEHQEHIFEPFFTTKDEGKGTGLGLAMIYGFAQRSGGFVDVTSKEGIGSTFKIYFPRAEDDKVQPVINKSQNTILPEGSETLLVVDDEAVLLELAREQLEKKGYRVLTANNGIEAIEILNNEKSINMLFSDVVMPGGVNGYELAEQAIRINPKIKVLLASGHTGKVMKENSASQALFEKNMLNKPYSQSEMLTIIRKILDEKLTSN
ncbi:MAG: PAS domain S-box protein [Gammaproteobacteria bacterium]|nr:PAS domain S-box protein [Gammaproteobacteria bacterium]